MILAFKLSMPHNNSWNGKWSGEDKLYVITRNLPKQKAKEIITQKSYYHNFGDGWGASISVTHVDSKEAAKLRKKSKGFCGYDWMVDSIIQYGKILNIEQREALAL